MVNRCQWVEGKDPLYVKYHDEEWGSPILDDRKLFEMLCLEGAQAGLSWWTILQKRENYREAFDQFDPDKIVLYDEKKLEELMNNKGIVRNKLKIKSIVTNSEAFLRIKEKHGSFSSYIWSFVQHTPIINQWEEVGQIPVSNDLSDKMSKQLKKDGFKFIGSTICYSFLQAVGMINDHTTNCHCHPSNK